MIKPDKQPALSLVIPVLNEEKKIGVLLKRLQEIRALEVEVIVSDGGSKDKTIEIVKPWVDRVVSAPTGRARQMNAGAAVSRGAYILFLHADTVLPDNLLLIVEEWISHRIRWGFFTIKLSGVQPLLRWVERGINWRSHKFKKGTGDQCLFFCRDFFWELGGFSDLPLMEDVDICQRAKQAGIPRLEKGEVITSSRRWERNGVAKTIFFMWWLQIQYYLGRSPKILAKKYYPKIFPDSKCYPSMPYLDFMWAQLAKNPELGTVKTRMEPELTQGQCLKLHRYLVDKSYKQVFDCKLLPINLWVTNTSVKPFPHLAIKKFQQIEGSLGEKMLNIVETTLAQDFCRGVFLSGSDCPFFTQQYLNLACVALRSDNDVVLGPASDGGYVLLGMKTVIPELFKGIDWGTESVLLQTLEKCRTMDLKVYLLPVLSDIDRPEDLQLLGDAGQILQ